jgi:hypothetical protein
MIIGIIEYTDSGGEIKLLEKCRISIAFPKTKIAKSYIGISFRMERLHDYE